MSRYLKINWILFRNSYIRDSMIPGYVISVMLNHALEIAVSIVFFDVLFNNTSQLAGWNYWQVIFLYAFSTFIVETHSAWTKRGVRSLAQEMVREGALDFYLTKPADPMLMVSINRPRVFDFTNSVFFLALMIFAAAKSGMPIGASNIIWFIALGILAFILFYFLQILLLIPVFWFVKLYSLQWVMNRVKQFMRYPAGVMPLAVRTVLFTLFPIIAVSYIPASTLFFKPDFLYILYMCFITFAFGYLTRYFWGLGVRHYGSASS